jgi:hypothetical protein
VSAFSPEDWKDLFVATAGASAALTGLVFVAVSINIERILALPGVPERALQTLVLLIGVVVVSIFGLVPGQSDTALGVELLVEGVLVTAAAAVLVRRSLTGPMRRSWVGGRFGTSLLATLPFAVGGLSLLASSGGGLYWTLAGIVAAIVGGVLNAWVLLVEILR